MDLEGLPPVINSSFPPDILEKDVRPQFWTIGDDDFEPDPIPLHHTPPPEMDQPSYDEYSEAAARAGTDEPTISLEEQEYLGFLENLQYSEFVICHSHLTSNPNLPS